MRFLGHFSISGGSKNFSMGDMMMSKVSKRLPRAFQRASNYDHATDHSSFIGESFEFPTLFLVLDKVFLNDTFTLSPLTGNL